MAKTRIIVVDDEQYVTTSLVTRFHKLGHEVRVANDGTTALELALQSEAA